MPGFAFAALFALAQTSPPPDSPRPIDIRESVWIEELTWMEVRDAMKAGKNTVIIATGGVEQNGPYLATGKHNYVLRATCPSHRQQARQRPGARRLSPSCPKETSTRRPAHELPRHHQPDRGHLPAPAHGDLRRASRTHGFEHIVLIGDSGGNQEGMKAVADRAQREVGRRQDADPLHSRVLRLPGHLQVGRPDVRLGRESRGHPRRSHHHHHHDDG